LLAVTPLIISAMATSAFAQEAAAKNPVFADTHNTAVVAAQADTVVYPLKVSVPVDGTYVFTSPAQNALTISLDGTTILTVPRDATATSQPYRVITSLTAGDHLIELEGVDITLEQVALVSMYELGGEPVSIANAAVSLSREEAQALAARVSNGTALPSGERPETMQVAAANVARQPFMIGGSSESKPETSPASAPATVAAAAASTARGATSSGAESSPASMASASGAGSSGGGVFRRSVEGAIQTAKDGTGSGGSSGTPGTPGTPSTPVPPTGTPVVPVVVPSDMARASALTPPTGVTLTQAVQIVGGASDAGVVSRTGQSSVK